MCLSRYVVGEDCYVQFSGTAVWWVTHDILMSVVCSRFQTGLQHELPHGAPPGVHKHLLERPAMLPVQQLRPERPRLRLLPHLHLRQLLPERGGRRRLQRHLRRGLQRWRCGTARRRVRRRVLPPASAAGAPSRTGRTGILSRAGGWGRRTRVGLI